ncbi:MAG: PQQ-dependent sugar dehydrogenase [Candidatus Nitrosotenuis sp.]
MKSFFLILCVTMSFLPAFASHTGNDESDGPTIYDPSLKVERFVQEGIPNSPTTMAFVGNDILVLERYTGLVRLVRDGQLLPEPVLDVAVAKDGERGMLGITSIGNMVYLYFTAANSDAGQAIENRIFRYTWNGEKLVDPVLLKTLPSENFYHNGGAMTNFDGQVYAVIGDNGNYGRLQNRLHDWKNDTSVILRVDPPGSYYAIGIRNSFGIAVDPLTGNMWDTENGPDEYDEINFVPENFNSGWIEIMGPANNQTKIESLPKYENYAYSEPEFSWQKPVAPTAIEFGTKELGQEDKIFVVDCNTGSLYRFTLDSERTGLVFESPELSDLVLNVGESTNEIILGNGFGCATDIERGPDGFLYIVSLSDGSIYRIIPAAIAEQNTEQLQRTRLPIEYIISAIIGIAISITMIAIKKRRSLTS